MSKRKFPMGQLVATLAVIELMRKESIRPRKNSSRCMSREIGAASAGHAHGQRARPDGGGRLVSIHEVAGRRVWIVTEADRARTTALLPEEF